MKWKKIRQYGPHIADVQEAEFNMHYEYT